MPRSRETEFSLAYLNPWMLTRFAYLRGRRGWQTLWRAPGANARFFIATTYFWALGIAITEPYKALFLSKLGLSNLAIGGFFALDMGLRIFGVLIGGLLGQRWGHKRTLLIFDTLSWVVPCAIFAFATEPWQVYVATCLTATNALVAGSVVQLMLDGTPEKRRAPVFALFNLTFVVPMILLPGLVGWGVDAWGLVRVIRVMFALTSVLTLTGILWRRVALKESEAVNPGADLTELMGEVVKAAKHLLNHPSFLPVLASYLLANAWMNVNRVYYALYVTKVLGVDEGLVGGLSVVGSLAFVAASLAWVPRLRAGKEARLFFFISCLTALPLLGLGLAQHTSVVFALATVGGLAAAMHGPLLSERLVDLMPRGREGLAQSLLACLMQAAVALSLVLGGALFETHFSAFPWLAGGLAVVQAWVAWRLFKTKARL